MLEHADRPWSVSPVLIEKLFFAVVGVQGAEIPLPTSYKHLLSDHTFALSDRTHC